MPLLFLIYINDMKSACNENLFLACFFELELLATLEEEFIKTTRQ